MSKTFTFSDFRFTSVQGFISDLYTIIILKLYIVVWSIVNHDTNFYGNFVFCGQPSGYYWEYDSTANKVVMKQVSVKELLWSKYI